VRAGNTLTGYYTTDGAVWTQLGSVDIAMGSTVYVGLAVTSHNNGAVSNATFDTVYLNGLIGPAPTASNALAVPGAPSLSLGAGTGITLSWGAVSGSTGYAVERSSDGATWAQVGTTGAGVTAYNDNNLAGSFRYYYRVSALTSGGRSAPSAAASLVNRPSAPFNVTVTSWTTSALILNWRDVSGDSGYRVERSSDGVNFTPVGTVGTNVISFTNSGLSAGTTYCYRIIALSPFGDSPSSAVASGATRAAAAPAPPPPADPAAVPARAAPADGGGASPPSLSGQAVRGIAHFLKRDPASAGALATLDRVFSTGAGGRDEGNAFGGGPFAVPPASRVDLGDVADVLLRGRGSYRASARRGPAAGDVLFVGEGGAGTQGSLLGPDA
jgi:hypothetical protein